MTLLKILAGYLALVAWVTALVAGIITGEYEPLRDVTPVVLIVFGFLFGNDVVFRRRNGNGDKK